LKVTAKPFSAADGRKFGLTVGGAFLVLAAIFLWKSREIGLYITATLGAALVVGGLVAPKSLGPVNSAWMKFALALSTITTPIFMSIVYFVVMTPFGIVRRTVGSNPMKHSLVEGSYFRRRDTARKSDMRRQF
jgi:hypothetical protein